MKLYITVWMSCVSTFPSLKTVRFSGLRLCDLRCVLKCHRRWDQKGLSADGNEMPSRQRWWHRRLPGSVRVRWVSISGLGIGVCRFLIPKTCNGAGTLELWNSGTLEPSNPAVGSQSWANFQYFPSVCGWQPKNDMFGVQDLTNAYKKIMEQRHGADDKGSKAGLRLLVAGFVALVFGLISSLLHIWIYTYIYSKIILLCFAQEEMDKCSKKKPKPQKPEDWVWVTGHWLYKLQIISGHAHPHEIGVHDPEKFKSIPICIHIYIYICIETEILWWYAQEKEENNPNKKPKPQKPEDWVWVTGHWLYKLQIISGHAHRHEIGVHDPEKFKSIPICIHIYIYIYWALMT